MDMSLLTARLSIPVVIKETMKPKEVIVTPAGEIVLDMGQNMVEVSSWMSIFLQDHT